MNASAIIFYILSAFILGLPAGCNHPQNFPVRYMVVVFTDWYCWLIFLVEVEFIAAVQIIVYVGGIVVLISSLFFSRSNRAKKCRSLSETALSFPYWQLVFGFAFTYQSDLSIRF